MSWCFTTETHLLYVFASHWLLNRWYCFEIEVPIDEIDEIVDEVIKTNSAMVEEFKSGKDKAFNALIGQVMKASKGKANPSQVASILKDKLSK